MIKLTRLNGDPVWIRPALIGLISLGDFEGTIILFIPDSFDGVDVRETPEEIIALAWPND